VRAPPTITPLTGGSRPLVDESSNRLRQPYIQAVPRRLALTLASAPLAVLAAAAIQQLLVAVGLLSLGTTPGADPPGQALVSVAIVALLVGAVAWPIAALHLPRGFVFAFPLAAGAFVIAHFVAYDPYYLPTLRRYSDGGGVSVGGVAAAGAVILAASLAALRWRRVGSVVIAVATLGLATAAVLTGGH
jgi:hypothetical protein